MKILFLTGNAGKLGEATHILAEHDVVGKKLDLKEIQSMDPQEIIREKLEEARAHVGDEVVLVDDVSLWIGDLGFPGPLIKFMVDAIGADGVVQFANAFKQETVRVECTLGVLVPGKEPMFFTGSVNGTLVGPRGENGFGFDPIVIPEGETRTWAEMSREEKNMKSHRHRALEKVRQYLSR